MINVSDKIGMKVVYTPYGKLVLEDPTEEALEWARGVFTDPVPDPCPSLPGGK